MKKVILWLLLLLSLLATVLLGTACEYSLEYTEIEVTHYPDKIVYVVGVDDKLDLTGGEVLLTTRGGDTEALPMTGKHTEDSDSSSIIEGEFYITHNIDFNKPGVYVVEIKRHDRLITHMPVQVIDLSDDSDN